MGPNYPLEHRRANFADIGCAIVMLGVVALVVLPVFFKPTHVDESEVCSGNLKSIVVATFMYAEANDGRLPPRSSWCEALSDLDEDMFLCPTTKRPYVFNNVLGGRIVSEIPDRAKVLLAWDAPAEEGTPPHAGKYNVVYLDGHITWVAEDEFHQLIKGGDTNAELP